MYRNKILFIKDAVLVSILSFVSVVYASKKSAVKIFNGQCVFIFSYTASI